MLYGKTVVITGVSAGIGARTAELAVSLGADVVGIDLNEPKVPSASFIKGNLSTPEGVLDVVQQLPKCFDALLNVAGISGTVGAEATLAVNFYGLRALSEAVAPSIREGGAIVNVASVAGYGWRANLERAKAMVGVPGFPDIKAVMQENGIPDEIGYPLSKELLILWTQKAAQQALFKDRGIRVNAVSPGPVETTILKEFRAVLGDKKVDSDITRVGRAATPSDIAPVILFLASDGARWINGANISNDGGLEASINAEVLDTGKIASRAPASGLDDVKAAVSAAAEAFPAWSKTGPGERRALLFKAADVLASKADEFAKIMIEETGGTAPWAGFNTMLAAGILREAASMTTQIQGEIIPSDKPGTLSMGVRQAAGVCLGIAPWNAPVILGTRAIAMALACGNTVILKASEACPGLHLLIGRSLVEAGFPDGVVNVLTNAPQDAAEIVEALIAAPEVRRVNFTGSTKVGRIIGELCGRHIKPALLELGGKAPFIVLDDADIEAAVNGAIFGAFANMGQICMSTERIIVDEKIADEFVEKLAARARKLPAGDPRGHVVLGSLVTQEAAAKMEELIADGVGKGAKLVAGGKREGSVVEATLLDHVKPGMRSFEEESFGPVKPIIRVKDEAEAIRIANESEYGLSSSVYSRDVQRAMAVAEQIQSGICHINGPTVHDEAQMPFGGVKNSGYGRFGGKAAINEFTDLRWITIEDPHQHYPF